MYTCIQTARGHPWGRADAKRFAIGVCIFSLSMFFACSKLTVVPGGLISTTYVVCVRTTYIVYLLSEYVLLRLSCLDINYHYLHLPASDLCNRAYCNHICNYLLDHLKTKQIFQVRLHFQNTTTTGSSSCKHYLDNICIDLMYAN